MAAEAAQELESITLEAVATRVVDHWVVDVMRPRRKSVRVETLDDVEATIRTALPPWTAGRLHTSAVTRDSRRRRQGDRIGNCASARATRVRGSTFQVAHLTLVRTHLSHKTQEQTRALARDHCRNPGSHAIE